MTAQRRSIGEIDPTPEFAIELRLVGIAACVMLAEILWQES